MGKGERAGSPGLSWRVSPPPAGGEARPSREPLPPASCPGPERLPAGPWAPLPFPGRAPAPPPPRASPLPARCSAGRAWGAQGQSRAPREPAARGRCGAVGRACLGWPAWPRGSPSRSPTPGSRGAPPSPRSGHSPLPLGRPKGPAHTSPSNGPVSGLGLEAAWAGAPRQPWVPLLKEAAAPT